MTLSAISSGPIPTAIICRSFESVQDARRAADVRTEGVRLTLATPLALSLGQRAIVILRIAGKAHQVMGNVEASGAEAVIGFAGPQAAAVREALSILERPSHPRESARFKCWLAATVTCEDGTVVRGQACDVSAGGVRLMLLSGKLGAGVWAQVKLGELPETIPARVRWYLGTGVAGLSFVADEASTAYVQRLVQETAARESTWVERTG